eukprot:scaffold2590_cov160-Amphora_coffeaeformis.AAC.7
MATKAWRLIIWDSSCSLDCCACCVCANCVCSRLTSAAILRASASTWARLVRSLSSSSNTSRNRSSSGSGSGGGAGAGTGAEASGAAADATGGNATRVPSVGPVLIVWRYIQFFPSTSGWIGAQLFSRWRSCNYNSTTIWMRRAMKKMQTPTMNETTKDGCFRSPTEAAYPL